MKKITIILCMLVIGFVNAQDIDKDSSSDKLTFAKGTSLLNGGLFFNNTKVETDLPSQTQEDKRFGFGVNSSYGYAISDDLFLGLGIGYTHNKREVDVTGDPTQEFTNNSFRVFPYVRYYKGLGKRFAFFVQGEAQYSKTKTKVNGQDTNDTNSFFVGVRPGLTFMVSKCLALETTIGALGYTTATTENTQSNIESDNNSFNLSFNTANLIFGLSYYF
ncbi:outer membrane beta-barrel protein [uncultured Kordia sp.]|uniref:outer membrane beta-barrel protein n=1 Tax=uncultured Kordia sp. TaxID=507699 RepID=UPI002630E515|nr:outer membrane beta-barrel protein [uncultured Kordia sp.]